MSDTNTPHSSQSMTRNLLWAGGGAALVGLGLAAGLLMRSPGHDTAAEQAAMNASSASSALLNNSSLARDESPNRAESKTHRRESTHRTVAANDTPVAAASTCANCGVIESVHAVQRNADGSGVGAVAGGVLGGVVGNQMGKGEGKTAMTILGAIGGGVAGNEIEKRQRGTTVYEVRVRMDDGSIRTVTQATAPSTGARVEVEGQNLRYR